MKIANLIALLGVGFGNCLAAQGTDQAPVASMKPALAPAESPPEDFSAAQYVDSLGCIFVRAKGEGGAAWVPRLARSGQAICGAVPSLTAAAGEAPQVRPMAQPDITERSGAPSDTTALEAAQNSAREDVQPENAPTETGAAQPDPVEGANAPAAGVTQTPQALPIAPNGAALPGRFVQVGSFRGERTAEGAAQQIELAGLPVSFRRWRRGSVYYRVVLAGPFYGAEAQQQGLQVVKDAGFSDAYIRD